MVACLFVGCTSVFYHLLYSMEEIGLLDPLDEVNLFCLHYVYLTLTIRSSCSLMPGPLIP